MKEVRIGDEVYIGVLGYREDNQWCALALEMDLRGYGQSFDEALKDLHESMTMQIGFALFKNEPGMIFHPADPMYFSLYAQVRNDRIMALAAGSSAPTETEREREFAITGVPIPSANIVADRQEGFALSNG